MPILKANQIEINYEIQGEGPPLTMIMGMSCSLRQWQWMTDKLSENFLFVCYDNKLLQAAQSAGLKTLPERAV